MTVTDHELQPVDVTVVDTTEVGFTPVDLPGLGAGLEVLHLIDDPDTGMQVMKIVYRAGFVNRWHTHPCAHGIYVLSGTLVSHRGSHPAGSFVWFPEGGTMEHGASPDGDVTMLFVTNKPFGIQHLPV